MKQYKISLVKVTGLLVLARRSSVQYTGTVEQLKKAYQDVLLHNLLFGWWGIISFFWTIMALIKNNKMMQSLHNLSQHDGPTGLPGGHS